MVVVTIVMVPVPSFKALDVFCGYVPHRKIDFPKFNKILIMEMSPSREFGGVWDSIMPLANSEILAMPTTIPIVRTLGLLKTY